MGRFFVGKAVTKESKRRVSLKFRVGRIVFHSEPMHLPECPRCRWSGLCAFRLAVMVLCRHGEVLGGLAAEAT